MNKPQPPLLLPGKIICLVKDERGRIVPDKSEQERVNYIIEEIVRKLRQNKNQKQSEREVRDAVIACCGLIMQNTGVRSPKRSDLPAKQRPATLKKLTTDIRKRAISLFSLLQDMPIELEICVFDSKGFDPLYAKEEFFERLKRFSSVTYRAPPLCPPVKDSCVEIAVYLMRTYSKDRPTGTKDGLLQQISALLYEGVRPSANAEPVNFKRACDRVLGRYRMSK